MESKRDELFKAYEHLLRIRNECACEISTECNIADLTVRQIEYLKIIDKHSEITFSKLADITKNSKPTITEMINKFISFKCAFKERSQDDRRISFIHLTEYGRRIARHEQIAILRVVDRMMQFLNDDEIDQIIKIFRKVR